MSSKRGQTKFQLLEAGLEVLADDGPEGLTIDALCARVNVTKGSFYHHFRNRDGFYTALLEHWMEECTERKKRLADEKGTPEEKYARIVEYATTLPHDLEKAMRAWAMRFPLAAEYQTQVDRSRQAYLAGLLRELLEDEAQAEAMAQIVLSSMVGLRHLYPAVTGDARRESMRSLHALMGIQL